MFNRVYKSINTLPIWNFFRIIETSDIRYLYRKKNYDGRLPRKTSRLMQTWENILQEFYRAEGSSQYEMYVREIKKIHELEIDKFVFHNLFFILKHTNNQEAIELLKSYGIQADGKKLNRISKQYKQVDNKLRMKQADFETNHGSQKIDVDFANIKDQVEHYKGFYLDPRKVTVREWIGIIKNMKKHGQERSNKTGRRTQPGNR